MIGRRIDSARRDRYVEGRMTLTTTRSFNLRDGNPAAGAALARALASAATIAGALFFQLVVKLPPCPLCYTQRIPYYVAIPLGAIVAVAALRHAPRAVVVGGLVALAVLMLWNAGFGVYHSGIEWKWWPGPTDCSGPISSFGTTGNLMKQLESISLVRCDEAAWRFLGLSLAGWNVLISLGLAGVALAGAAAAWRRT